MKPIIKVLLFMLPVILLSQCEKDESNPKVQIPDNNFLNALIELGVDTNGDGEISRAEAKLITYLDVHGDSISDLTGIEKFISLDSLDCSRNQLTSLDVSNNTALVWLDCWRNQLTSLDVSNNTKLLSLDCGYNQITSLDVSNNALLEKFICERNPLGTLDISNNTSIWYLRCYNCELTTLDVSNCTALSVLYCHNNNSFKNENQLTTLDISSCIALKNLYCSKNQLNTLDVSNNDLLTTLWLEKMPSLYKVCVWEMPFPPDGVDVETEDSPNVYFTTDCSK